MCAPGRRQLTQLIAQTAQAVLVYQDPSVGVLLLTNVKC